MVYYIDRVINSHIYGNMEAEECSRSLPFFAFHAPDTSDYML